MNTLQLKSALEGNPVTEPFFDGIFSYDTLRLIKEKPRLIICNTDHSKNNGKHWLAFFFPENEPEVVEMFDSLGNNLSAYPEEIVHFCSRFCRRCRIGSIRVQPNYSRSCAQFCLYFAYKKCLGYSFQCILKKLLKPRSSVNISVAVD